MTEIRCGFLIDDMVLSPKTFGGKSTLAFSHYELLAQQNNISIILFLFSKKRNIELPRIMQSDTWEEISSRCEAWHTISFFQEKLESSQISQISKVVFDPTAYRLGNQLSKENLTRLQSKIESSGLDFIWAEDLVPATIAQRAVPDLPVIYSHLDWKWKIKQHRNSSKSKKIKKRFHFWMSRRHEEKLVRQVAGCVSASISEASDLQNLGAKSVEYFPTTYKQVAPPARVIPNTRPRIVHLGGMNTTANRIGLQRFLDVSWPLIKEKIKPIPEFWVIGDLSAASRVLLSNLNQEAVCTGFVEDLSSVLRFGDIHIVPWEHNTGTRTRIPLVLAHGQVLVSTKPGAACIHELQNNQNAILVDDLQQMSNIIVELIHNADLRMKIAKNALATFNKSFTRAALQPRFNKFISNLVHNNYGS